MAKFEYLVNLPSELRDTIFGFCDLEWNGEMPALIVAMRTRQRYQRTALQAHCILVAYMK